jgi:hypothetical protein
MAFIMDGLDKEAYDRTYSDRQLIDRIKTYFRPEAGKIALVTGMVVVNSLLDSALPILVASGLDRVTGEDVDIDRELHPPITLGRDRR